MSLCELTNWLVYCAINKMETDLPVAAANRDAGKESSIYVKRHFQYSTLQKDTGGN